MTTSVAYYFMQDTTETELHEMVDTCKAMVLESAECSLERKWFVRRLIELRLRIREIQDSSDEKIYELQLVRGHHFKPQEYYISTTNPVYCDHCGGAIWTMLQYWYKCNGKSTLKLREYIIPTNVKHSDFLFQTATTAVIGTVSRT